MGGGKTSAAITYINDHPEKKFLYITPYLDEATRVNKACPAANFMEPSDKIKGCGFKKWKHTLKLLEEERNVASTHAAAVYYTPEMLEKLKEKDYTIIIDESVNAFEQGIGISNADVEMLVESGYMSRREDGTLVAGKRKYPEDGKYSHIIHTLLTRPLLRLKNDKSETAKTKKEYLWYWVFPKEFLTCVEDVIVLTYMFEGSMMESWLNVCEIDYRYIGVSRSECGKYRFSDKLDYMPEYVRSIKNLVHVVHHDKMNAIGGDRRTDTNLSKGWFKSHPDGIEKLRRNLVNYYRNLTHVSTKEKLCGVYPEPGIWSKLRGDGFRNRKLTYNQRSTNAYKAANTLAYLVNVYPNKSVYGWFYKSGFPFDQDKYALSTMIQWIWRSAIRDGEEITIYVPSMRMRMLLEEWMERLSNGEHA